MISNQNNTVYTAGVSTEPKCKASWCNLEACFFKSFCRYHWKKLAPLMKQAINRSFVKQSAIQARETALNDAVNFLIREHITSVPCYRCRGRGFNITIGYKICSWCKGTALRPKID